MDNISWKLIDKYFTDNPNNLVAHHLESYNDFFKGGIHSIFRENNPIRFVQRADDVEKPSEALLYLGGKDGSKIYFGKPIIYDDRKTHYMYPNDARLRNMTYGVTVHYDVDVVFVTYDDKGTRNEEVVTLPDKIYLGRFPIMLQSDLCILKSLSKEVRFNMGECKNDYGGYFIIDGKEKVIVSQEKFANNTLYIAKKKDDDEFSHSAEIRSVSEDASKPIRTTAVKIVAPGAKYTNNQIVVSIPNVRKPIPLFILMRALGVVSDKDIIRVCLLDLDKNKDMVDLFIPSVHDANRIFNQETALEFIATFTKRATISSVVEILSDFFLPHIGEINFMEKAYFVGYMVNRLLKVFTNLDKPTDRDNFRFKRVELTGSLLYDLFREYYLIQCHAIALKVDRMYTLHKGQYKDNIVALIQDNYRDFFKDRDVEKGLRKAFKGNWGSQTHTKRVGVVQDLNRLSWNTFMSHLRKINLPLDASAKVVGPRHLNGSQWGFIDPLDTPDGGNIGLHKHLAISTQITSGSSAFPMIKWIRRNIAMRLVLECSPEYLMSSSKIFVNGNWIGVTDNPLLMVDQMKLFRRNGILPVATSISFDFEHNEVYVYTDSGRLTRPLYYIQNEKPSFERKQVKDLLDSGKITWTEIVAGFKTKKDENYSFKNNKIYNVGELYGATGSAEDAMRDFKTHQSVVDYLDTAEEESALIATSPDDLKKSRFYTHMEIDPSLMLGVMGNQIIYPENNPFARNSFSCGQSKQAVSLYHSNYQMRIDKMGVILNSGQIPLIKSRYLDYINSESQPYGVNAIVAIMSYTGYNVEDAILINQGAIDRGLFRTTYYSMYEAREENASITGSTNSKFANVQNSNVQKKKAGYDYDQLDDNGLIKENTQLNDKTIVIGKVTSDVENPDVLVDDSVKPKKGQMGFVDKSFVTQGEEGTNIAKVRVREERIPAQGDKMASRAGQKGTIGLIISEEDMPFTADGIKPDLIINPHALPSRMTIGQIVESLLGVLCTHYGAFGDCTAFQTKGANYQTYAPLLVKAGFNSSGNQVMYNGMTGEQLEADIFIGPTYYMRLKHMVKDKINYRARGPNAMLTRQPVQGRANDGGLRIGEMERDGVMAHGMSYFLNESFMVRADEYFMAVCNKTGATAIYNEAKSLFLSPFADGPINFNINHDGTMNIKNLSKFGRSFSIVRIPYSLKLLLQELQVMNVQMRIITDDNVDQLMNLSYSMNVHKLMNDDGTDTSELINKLKNKFAKDKAQDKMRIASQSQSSESWDLEGDNEGKDDFSPETPDDGEESPAYPMVVYPHTETKATIAIITLFRDNDKGAREKQRREFIRRMNRIMAPYRYHIFIIEQSDDGHPFNIGKLENVGFKIAGEWEKTHDMKFTNFIFSDIDMIPDDELLQYYVKPIKKPLSLAIRGTRYDARDMESKKIFLGAVLGFNRHDFEEINGYPDNFWGWGGEDDALLYRLVASDVGTVQIPKVGAVIDLEEKKTLAEKLESVVKDNQRWEKLYIDLTMWQKNGLSNLNYKLMKMTDEAENTTQYLVDLQKLEDEKKYPELFKTKDLKFDWKKDKRLITDKYDKLRVEILDFAQQPQQMSADSFEVKPFEPVRFDSSSSVPYAPEYKEPIFTQMEKVYYYEDRSKPPIMCEIDDISVDGTVEVMDLSDGRIIRTRIENLAKVYEPTSQSPEQAPSPRFSPNSPSPVYEPKTPSPRFSPHSPEMPEKASIFDVEEEKADEEKEEDKKEEDKDKGENRKIIIDIKPE